jgi:S1-C subfamily serine protease
MSRRSPKKTHLLVATGLVAAAVGTSVALARGTATSVPALRAGVVDIETNLGLEGGAAAGTGMVLTPSGIVLTNNHVIRGATTVRVVLPSSGRTYNARVLGYSVAADVAVLSLQGASHLQTVTTSSARLRVRQPVTAVGNAGGTRRLVVAPGRITGLGKTITAGDGQNGSEQLTGLIETNAGLQPGDSGGPLFDAAHRVVGMNTAASAGFFLSSTASDSYAIPVTRALAIARQIQSGRASATVHVGATPFVGVQLQSTDGFFGGGRAGVVIAGVVPGSPADRAGLVPGNLVTALDGKAVGSLKAVSALLLRKSPGDTVRVSYADQAGNEQTATVTLASGPPQ